MKVWTTITSLRTGTLIAFGNPPRVEIAFDDTGHIETISEAYVHATIKDTLDACEKNAIYWEVKADELREEINREKAMAIVQPLINEIKKL